MISVCLDIVQIGDVVTTPNGCPWKVNMFVDGQPAIRFRPSLAPSVIANYTPVIGWWPDECSTGPMCAVGVPASVWPVAQVVAKKEVAP